MKDYFIDCVLFFIQCLLFDFLMVGIIFNLSWLVSIIGYCFIGFAIYFIYDFFILGKQSC